MYRYSHCKIYQQGDPKKTAVAYVDIEAESTVIGSVGFLDTAISEGLRQEVTTETDFKFSAGTYNIFIPVYELDLKITGYRFIHANEGGWKNKFRWTLVLEG